MNGEMLERNKRNVLAFYDLTFNQGGLADDDTS